MIKPDSNYLKSMPEKYFTIPKGEKVDSDVLAVVLERMDFMIELLINNHPYKGDSEDDVLQIAYIIEAMAYQARTLALHVEAPKHG